jgi:hypothetical protein
VHGVIGADQKCQWHNNQFTPMVGVEGLWMATGAQRSRPLWHTWVARALDVPSCNDDEQASGHGP